jgi:hypothetical protein
MTSADPASLSIEQIEAELADVAGRLRERDQPTWLLEARRWRLEFELRFRQRGAEDEEQKTMNPADEIPQSERRRILAEDRLARNTYFSHANDPELELGGRFSKVIKTTVTGASPVGMYPRQPAGSPWACDPVGDEPPLGVSVEAMEPVGEVHEREQGHGPVKARPKWRRL